MGYGYSGGFIDQVYNNWIIKGEIIYDIDDFNDFINQTRFYNRICSI